MGWSTITPNVHGDWINHRTDSFASLIPLYAEDGSGLFKLITNGLKTNRDAWNYNSSLPTLQANTARMINHYNEWVERYDRSDRRSAPEQFVEPRDPKLFSWDAADFDRIRSGRRYDVEAADFRQGLYRPFHFRFVNAASVFNNRTYRLPAIYPSIATENAGICISGFGGSAPFSALVSSVVPNNAQHGAGNAIRMFPRWTYPPIGSHQTLEGLEASERQDNLNPLVVRRFQDLDSSISADDVFMFVYGMLHSIDYRTTFEADLKKSLPRIPLAETAAQFWAFATAGRELSRLHTEFERVEPWPSLQITTPLGFDPTDPKSYRVTKMAWAKRPGARKADDKSGLVVNEHIMISDIPAEAHWYSLGSRSALDWLVESFQVKTDKASGIVNDPNDWGLEHGKPTYIFDLIRSVVTVAIHTKHVVDSLPPLRFS